MRKTFAITLLAAALLAGAAAAQSVTVSDKRLALAQLAAASGGGAPDGIMRDSGQAIYLNAGTATPEELDRAADAAGAPDAIVAGEEGFVAHLPVVVLTGATLKIGPGTRVAFAPDTFLLSFGKTRIEGARLAASATGDDEDRAFLAGVGATSVHLTDSHVSGFGSAGGGAAAGLYLQGQGLLGGSDALTLSGNTFEELGGVVLDGIGEATVTGNRFSAFRGTALRLIGDGAARIEDNVFARGAGDQALHASGSQGLEIAENDFAGGRSKGLRIDDGARAVEISGNRIAGFGGAGLTFAEGAGCLLVADNRIDGNGGRGIVLDGPGDFVLSENELRDNAGPAISVTAQAAGSRGLVLKNTVAGNRTGLRGTSLSELRIARNDLSDQLPRLLSGDLDQMTPLLLRESRGDGAGSGDLRVVGVDARPAVALRRDAAPRAFEACRGEGRA